MITLWLQTTFQHCFLNLVHLRNEHWRKELLHLKEGRQATKRKRLSVQSSAVKNKRTTGREAEIDDTEGVDVADNSFVEVCEQVYNEELGNGDYDDIVDYGGDNVTLEPICFEDISWAPPIFKCDL